MSPTPRERWPDRPGATGRVHVRWPAVRGARATRSPRRCSRTASACSAARSSITARAGCWARVPRSRTRSVGRTGCPGGTPNCAHAGRDLRGTRRREPEPLAEPPVRRWRINDLFRAAHPGGVLLQDLHVRRSAWHRWYEPAIRRAAGLGRARLRRTPIGTPSGSRTATCWSSAPARRASPRARGVSVRRTGHALRRAARARWLAARRARRDDRRPAGATMAHRSIATLAARPNVTLLTRTTAFGYFPHNLVGLCERLTDHLAAPPAGTPRERLWQVRAREVVLAHRRGRAAARIPGQRPPAYARVRRLDVPASLRRQRRLTHRRRDGLRCSLRDRARPARGRRDGALVADVRDTATGAAPAAAREAGLEVVERATVLGTSGRLGLRSVELGRVVDGTILDRRTIACDALLDVRRPRRACISSRSRAASSRGTRVARPFCPTGTPSASARRSLPRRRRPRVGAQGRLRGRRRRSRAAGRDAAWQPTERPRVTSTRWARRARCGRARDRRRHVRSSTFRTTSRRRISRWPRAKASCPSSTSSATRRRAWRPTRARRRT